MDSGEARIEACEEEWTKRKLFVDGLPEIGEKPRMASGKDAGDAVWKYLKKVAPTFLSGVKEIKAAAPNKLSIRLETEAKTANLRIQCKLAEENGTAPKVLNKKISMREGCTEGEKATTRLFAYMMGWVSKIYGESAQRKFLCRQKEIQIAVRVPKTKGNKKEVALVPKTITKFTKLNGTKAEVLIEKSFAQLCCDSATAPRDENMEVFFEEEFDNIQVKSNLPHIRTEAKILEAKEFEAEVEEKRREEGQRAPRWLVDESEEEEAEAEKDEKVKNGEGRLTNFLIHDDDEEQIAAKKRKAKEQFAGTKGKAAKRQIAEAYFENELEGEEYDENLEVMMWPKGKPPKGDKKGDKSRAKGKGKGDKGNSKKSAKGKGGKKGGKGKPPWKRELLEWA